MPRLLRQRTEPALSVDLAEIVVTFDAWLKKLKTLSLLLRLSLTWRLLPANLAFCDILRIFEQNPNGTPQRQIARNGEKPQALPKS
jgi:hypothetical protein